jgi:hypothetical protein
MSSQGSRTRAFTRFGTGDLQSSADMGMDASYTQALELARVALQIWWQKSQNSKQLSPKQKQFHIGT